MVRMCVFLGSCLLLYVFGVGKVLFYLFIEEELVGIVVNIGLWWFMLIILVDLFILFKNLEQVCEQGYIVDQEEYVVGLNCIVFVIYDDVGSVVVVILILGLVFWLMEDCFISQGELVWDIVKDISMVFGLKFFVV